MAIIRYTKDANIKYAYLNIFPDQFKSETYKKKDSWMKNTMDYFANKAYGEYLNNKDTFVKNYDLLKGILIPEDFYQEQEVKSFTDMLEGDLDLPSYVKHYSIMTTPVNELVGEISKRPDAFKVKAFDDESQSEELNYKTQILQEHVINTARQKILQKIQMEGGEPPEDEEIEQMTMEQVKDQLDSYTSIAEKWANHVLTCQKAEFNLKEKSEDAFRDLIISNRQYYHIYEDNSKLGFNIQVENPKNVWKLTTPDRKYSSDPTGRNQGAYAGGTVHVMELSEIIEAIPDLTKAEIDHLRSTNEDYGLMDVRDSNIGKAGARGIGSIQYDTYDPLVLQTRMIIESEIKDNGDSIHDFLGLTDNVSAFGNKFVVVRSYWVSKKKVGKLVYIDELGNEQSSIVDEYYKSGTIPTQISLDWGWINQWYEGIKIADDIYHVKPYKLLNYFPIIGTTHEIKNTESRSVVDLMKPFQAIYNICMNQLWKLLEKEIGNVASINIRRIPIPKDGDASDALEQWELEARERGIIFDDDSPENTKAPVSNTSIARNIDLTRSNEIQSRYNLAQQIKAECWELVGMSKARMGSVAASATATGTNTEMQQSYTQTEPLFVAHEYVMGQLYQAIIDASLFVESTKEESTLSYINSEGASAFVKVNGTDLSFRDLKVFLTNRPEDTKMFNELRQLSQAIIQNGGTLYDVIELYSTQSLREMKKTFKDLRDRQIEQQQQAQQLEQQKLEQQQQQFAQQVEQAERIRQEDIANEVKENELDRINKKEIALIQAYRNNENAMADNNNDGIADALQLSNMSLQETKANKDYELKLKEINSKTSMENKKLDIEKDKLNVARENMLNDEKIARLNAQGRSSKK